MMRDELRKAIGKLREMAAGAKEDTPGYGSGYVIDETDASFIERVCEDAESLLSAPEAAPQVKMHEIASYEHRDIEDVWGLWVHCICGWKSKEGTRPVEEWVAHALAAPPDAENFTRNTNAMGEPIYRPAEPLAGDNYERAGRLLNRFPISPEMKVEILTGLAVEFEDFRTAAEHEMAERERKARLQEMIALPVHAWPDDGATYPQEWGAELVKYRNERIRAFSTSAGKLKGEKS